MRKFLLIISVFFFTINVSGQQVKKIKKQTDCPSMELPACMGKCEFELRLEYPNAKNACNGQGYDEVKVHLLYKDPGNSCEADIDRVLNNTDNIAWKICKPDGTIVDCTITENYFPDESWWPPYHPGNPAPPGKSQLNANCFASLGAFGAGGGWKGGGYRFSNVTHFDSDFTQRTTCICNGDTIENSITLDETLLIGCCKKNDSTCNEGGTQAECDDIGGTFTPNGTCNDDGTCSSPPGEDVDIDNTPPPSGNKRLIYDPNLHNSNFVTGNFKLDSDNGLPNKALSVKRYDADNNIVWSKSYGSTGNNTGLGIAVDALGNSYATGKMEGMVDFDTDSFQSYGNEDVFFVKHSPDGEQLWAKSFGSVEQDVGKGICIDDNQNIYVVGFYESACDFEGITLLTDNASFNGFIAKYNPAGVQQWVIPIGGLGREKVNAIAYGNDGHLYITGNYYREANFGALSISESDYHGSTFIAKLDTDGQFIWASKFEDANYVTSGEVIMLDNLNNIYVAGIITKSPDSKQAILLKYSADGNLLHNRELESNGYRFWIEDMAFIEATGKIQLVGNLKGDITIDGFELINLGEQADSPDDFAGQDVFLGQMDTDLTFEWAQNEGGDKMDFGLGISIDSQGLTRYVGCSFGTSTLSGITQVGDNLPYVRSFNSQQTCSGFDSDNDGIGDECDDCQISFEITDNGTFNTISAVNEATGQTIVSKESYGFTPVGTFDGTLELFSIILKTNSGDYHVEVYKGCTGQRITRRGRDDFAIPMVCFFSSGYTIVWEPFNNRWRRAQFDENGSKVDYQYCGATACPCGPISNEKIYDDNLSPIQIPELLIEIPIKNYHLIEATLMLPGCMDSKANNYNPLATIDDGTCSYIGVFESTYFIKGSSNPIQHKNGNPFELEVLPNPNNGKFSISFKNANEGEMQLKVYNLKMQLVYESSSFIPVGFYHSKIDFSDKLTNGIYFLEVINDEEHFNKKIVVSR